MGLREYIFFLDKAKFVKIFFAALLSVFNLTLGFLIGEWETFTYMLIFHIVPLGLIGLSTDIGELDKHFCGYPSAHQHTPGPFYLALGWVLLSVPLIVFTAARIRMYI